MHYMNSTEKFDDLEKRFEVLRQNTDKNFEGILEEIGIQKKTLEEALREQVGFQFTWDNYAAAAASMEKEAADLKDQYHSFAAANAPNKSNKILNATETKRIADCDSDYIKAVRLYNNIYKLKKELDAVSDTLKTRQFMLKHITESVIAGVEKHTIR